MSRALPSERVLARANAIGTAGLNRMWDQFTTTVTPLELPRHAGRIDPARWNPNTRDTRDPRNRDPKE
jgi:hypothetical protein